MSLGIKSGKSYYVIADSVLEKCKVSKKEFDLASKKAAQSAQVSGQGIEEVSVHFVTPPPNPKWA